MPVFFDGLRRRRHHGVLGTGGPLVFFNPIESEGPLDARATTSPSEREWRLEDRRELSFRDGKRGLRQRLYGCCPPKARIQRSPSKPSRRRIALISVANLPFRPASPKESGRRASIPWGLRLWPGGAQAPGAAPQMATDFERYFSILVVFTSSMLTSSATTSPTIQPHSTRGCSTYSRSSLARSGVRQNAAQLLCSSDHLAHSQFREGGRV